MTYRALLALFVLIFAGCALATGPDGDADRALSPAVGIDFRAERAEYRQGETARVVLRNGSDGRIGYNLCHSARERRVGGEWRRIEPLRICTQQLDVLEPGAEDVLLEPITEEWEPGEYRMTTTLYALEGQGRAEVFTPAFTVRR